MCAHASECHRVRAHERVCTLCACERECAPCARASVRLCTRECAPVHARVCACAHVSVPVCAQVCACVLASVRILVCGRGHTRAFLYETILNLI